MILRCDFHQADGETIGYAMKNAGERIVALCEIGGGVASTIQELESTSEARS